jgi:hypothetical protein
VVQMNHLPHPNMMESSLARVECDFEQTVPVKKLARIFYGLWKQK